MVLMTLLFDEDSSTGNAADGLDNMKLAIFQTEDTTGILKMIVKQKLRRISDLKFVAAFDSFAVDNHIIAFIDDSSGDNLVAKTLLVRGSSVWQS